ncbi:MAG TPA: hypothetical protein VD931_01300, partial [Baekduia sp.]|nr:hypothetical protein [Baekduia sp.]
TSRGAAGTPTAVQSGDVLGEFQVFAADGTDLTTIGAKLYWECDGTVSTDIVPTALRIYTMNTAGTLQTRMRLTANGNLAIGNQSLPNQGYQLEVRCGATSDGIRIGRSDADVGLFISRAGDAEMLLNTGAVYNSYSAPNYVLNAKSLNKCGIAMLNGSLYLWSETATAAGASFNTPTTQFALTSSALAIGVATTHSTAAGGTIALDVTDTATSRSTAQLRINSSATAHTSAGLLDIISSATSASDLLLRCRSNSTNRFQVYADGSVGAQTSFKSLVGDTSDVIFTGSNTVSGAANIRIYGSGHATQANRIFQDAARHAWRSANGATDYLVADGSAITMSLATTATLADSGTTNQPQVFTVRHTSSGTAAAGFGVSMGFEAQSTTTTRTQYFIQCEWATATDASRAAKVGHYVYDSGGARLALQMEASGTASKIGFLGAVAVARPTVSGSRGGNAALASLLSGLANLGLITDSTTA